jgi:hypothetical protein
MSFRQRGQGLEPVPAGIGSRLWRRLGTICAPSVNLRA